MCAQKQIVVFRKYCRSEISSTYQYRTHLSP